MKNRMTLHLRHIGLVALLGLALVLTACGGGATPSTPASSAPASSTVAAASSAPTSSVAATSSVVSVADGSDELLAMFLTSQEKMAEVENYDAESLVLMDIHVEGQEQSVETTIEMTVFLNPLKAKMTTSLNAGDSMPGGMNFVSYIEQTSDGGAMLYMDMGGVPMANKLTAEQLAEQNTNIAASMTEFLNLSEIESIRKIGEEVVDGKQTIHVSAVLSGKALESAMQQALSSNSSLELSPEEREEVEEALSDIPDIEGHYWFEKDSGLIYQIKMDMTDLMSVVSEKMGQTLDSEAFSVSRMETTTKIMNLNNAKDFEVPASLKTP